MNIHYSIEKNYFGFFFTIQALQIILLHHYFKHQWHFNSRLINREKHFTKQLLAKLYILSDKKHPELQKFLNGMVLKQNHTSIGEGDWPS